jgi:hypothetical protein
VTEVMGWIEILIFFSIGRLPLILAVIVPVWFGLWQAQRRFRANSPRIAAVWFALGISPIIGLAVWYVGGRLAAEAQLKTRAAYVASLPHRQFDERRPRLLEVHGEISRETIEALLNAHLFDQVIQFNWFDRSNLADANIFGPVYTPDCITKAQASLEAIAEGRYIGAMHSSGATNCSTWSQLRLPLQDRSRDAVLYLENLATSYQYAQRTRTGSQSGPGAVEIREQVEGNDWLVAYAETPFANAPVISLWTSQRLLTGRLPPNGPRLLLTNLQ